MARRRTDRTAYWGAFILDWFKYLQDNDLTSSDFKILFFLCEKMNFNDNTAYIRQKNIADDLNMDKGNVSKCIKRLCEKQFIAKTENGFMINPHLFYIGKRNPQDRYYIREEFDGLLNDSQFEQRFYMDEDEYKLEEYPERSNEKLEDYLNNPDLF